VDSEENMALLVLVVVMLFTYVSNIVYLWRLQKVLKMRFWLGESPVFAIFSLYNACTSRNTNQ